MGLETGTYIDSLNAANPVGASDPKSEGDDHIRLIKSTVKNTFPNVNAAVNPSPADLNLLTGQQGIFLNDFFADGAGTADIITANFTPDVTLTDGVTVMIKAVGQITSTTPTFAPDGLAAAIIVKGSNVALALEDITGSDQTLILQYDATLSRWILLNPIGGTAPSITDYYKAGTFYIHSDGAEAPTFTLNGVVGSSLESVGPTGSGADNIWTALDGVPLTATAVMVRITNTLTGATNTDLYSSVINYRRTGSGAGSTTISGVAFYNRSGSNERDSARGESSLTVDSANTFDISFTTLGTGPITASSMDLIGFWN